MADRILGRMYYGEDTYDSEVQGYYRARDYDALGAEHDRMVAQLNAAHMVTITDLKMKLGMRDVENERLRAALQLNHDFLTKTLGYDGTDFIVRDTKIALGLTAETKGDDNADTKG